MNFARAFFGAVLAATAFALHAGMPVSTDGTDPSRWDPRFEALHAATHNHRVIFENADMRVLSVTVAPGEVEAAHHHPWPSVLVIDSLPRITDHDASGREIQLPLPEKIELPLVLKMPPQATHSVRNHGTEPLHLIRIEFKKGFPNQP